MRLEELNQTRSTLSRQANQARSGLDVQDIVSDERRIRTSTVTYLQATD